MSHEGGSNEDDARSDHDEYRSRAGSNVSGPKRRSSILEKLPHLHLPHMPKINSDVHFDLDEFHGKSEHIDPEEEEEEEEAPTVEVAATDASKTFDGKQHVPNGLPRLTSIDKPDPEKKARWRSIWLATFILFLVSVQFSIYFSSLWPYLQILDTSIHESFFGVVVAAFSAGQIIASPLFAKWSQTTKQVRIPVAFGICLCLSGNILYIFANAFPQHDRKWALFGARFIMGLASGITGIIRAYVATSSKLHERHRAIAQTTAAQSLGMTAGPIIQFCFYPMYKYNVWTDYGGVLYINEYTGPAFVSIIACITLLVLLLCYFREYYSGILVRTKEDPYAVVPKFSKFAAGLCIWFWFTMFFCVTNIETIESPYTMAIYNWTAQEAVFYNAIILGGSGFLSFCAYFIYATYGRRFIRERPFIVVGLCMLCSFYVITYPWPFYTRKLQYKYEAFTHPAEFYNGTLPENFTFATTTPYNESVSHYPLSNHTKEPVGCEDEFSWCTYTPWVPPEVYFCAYPLISLGFPTINVALSTLYSKILGPRRQNIMQSLMIMAGSAARLLGPIFISSLFQYYGPRVGWGIIALAVFTSIVSSLVFYKKLVPLVVRPKLNSGEHFKYPGGTLYRI